MFVCLDCSCWWSKPSGGSQTSSPDDSKVLTETSLVESWYFSNWNGRCFSLEILPELPSGYQFSSRAVPNSKSCGLFFSVFITFSLWAFCFLPIMIASVSSSRASSRETPFGTAAGVDFSFHAEVQVRPRRRPIPLYTCVTSISGRPSRSDGEFSSSSWAASVMTSQAKKKKKSCSHRPCVKGAEPNRSHRCFPPRLPFYFPFHDPNYL